MVEMLRGITNRIAGRRKVVDRSLDFSEVQDLLAELNGVTKINVAYSSGFSGRAFRGSTPIEVAEFVSEYLSPDPCRYFEATHQVFSDEQHEMHYVDLRAGELIAAVGTQRFKDTPHTTADLVYVLKSKK